MIITLNVTYVVNYVHDDPITQYLILYTKLPINPEHTNSPHSVDLFYTHGGIYLLTV